MFPSEIEGLQELARLSPEALTVMAERFERLAKQCRKRARWIQNRAHEADTARAEHEHRVRELCDTLRRYYRRGMSRKACVAALPQWDAAIVRYHYRLTVRAHREKNALHGECWPGNSRPTGAVRDRERFKHRIRG